MQRSKTSHSKRIRLWSLWPLLSLFALLTSAQEPLQDRLHQQTPLVAEGYALLKSGNFTQALQHFQQALSENKQDLYALLGQATIFTGRGKHRDALATYDTIVQTYPHHAMAWNGRGLAAYNLGDFDTALHSFKQATAEQPVNGFFYETLAWAQMCRGEYPDAAASAKKASLMYNKNNESSPYPPLIAYFAYLELSDQTNASRALKYAQQNKTPNAWPSPVVDYLVGSLDIPELISYVRNSAQETEAHVYIGLKLRAEKHSSEAQKHLQWVAQNGDSRVFEYTLARALNLQNSVALMTKEP